MVLSSPRSWASASWVRPGAAVRAASTIQSRARTPEADRTERQRAGVALAARLAGELAEADAVLLAVPPYNFGVSQHIKTWIDLVIAAPRDGSGANGTGPLLAGKPTVLVTVRGGAYGARDATGRLGPLHRLPAAHPRRRVGG